jgi:cytochrome c biogenesis protein CcdA/thiol-disulfide isomerase/thioredoxin
MDIALLFSSFFAGVLTVLAPCVLPILPIIIGSSLSGADRARPFFIVLGLTVSITLFTFLLKVSTLFINLPDIYFPFRVSQVSPYVTIWQLLSFGLIFFFGLTYLFPHAWDALSLRLGLAKKTDTLLHSASKKSGVGGALLVGAALGPVFSSCSPTYATIVATVLPTNIVLGMVYTLLYALGLACILVLVSLFGRSFVSKIQGFSDPDGWFRKMLGVIFLIVSLSILTGFDKAVEAQITDFVVENNLDVTKFEQKVLPKKMTENTLFQTTSSTKNSASSAAVNPTLNVTNSPKAPDFAGITDWINSNGETLQNLKGKVVLVDFWTYSCINCQRTLPHLTQWYDTYEKQGFVVIGVHAPEFSFEKKKENVAQAVQAAHIRYPVALDNDFATWQAYHNDSWPAEYLIDGQGIIRRFHVGEGQYAETETAIQALLAENNAAFQKSEVSNATVGITATGQYCEAGVCTRQSPESYTGYGRSEDTKNRKGGTIQKDTVVPYIAASSLQPNEWTFGGSWNIQKEQAIAVGADATISFAINAKMMYAVLQKMEQGSPGIVRVEVTDSAGKSVQTSISMVDVTHSNLYTLVDASSFLKDATVTLHFDKGVAINAFTFG